MKRSTAMILLGLGAAYVAGLWWLVAGTPAPASAPSPFPKGSSYSRSGEGAALAVAYLRERGHQVQPLLSSSLAGVAPGSVIFVIDPPHFPHGASEFQPLLTLEEERFVRQGGRVVLALDGSVPQVRVSELKTRAAWVRVRDDWKAVERIEPAGPAMFLEGLWLRDAYAVFTAADQPVIALKPMGEGDVIAIASASLFKNSTLDKASHLELLESLVEGRPAVYFDEGAHGLATQEGLTGLLVRWKLMPFLASLLVLALAVLVRNHHALGRSDRDDHAPPSDAVDLVETLGRLYARCLRDDEALGLHRDHLRLVVNEKTGLRGPALRKRVDELLAGAKETKTSTPKTNTFEHELSRINRALRRAHEHPR